SQIKTLRQQCERSVHQFPRFFAELRVEVRMIESVDLALESSCILRLIKDPRRDAQCTDAITCGPCILDLVSFANASHQHSAANMRTADDLASLDEKLDSSVRYNPAGL